MEQSKHFDPQCVSDDAERPQVDGWSVTLAQEDLRSSVSGTASQRSEHLVGILHLLGDSKIGDYEVVSIWSQAAK